MSSDLTISGMFTTEESSGAGGLCQPPHQEQAWVQTLTVPAECLSVLVTVHQRPSNHVYGLHVQVADPHTKELLAMIARPVQHALTPAGMIQQVVAELRATLLVLTDPEPF